jgi:uroporphyrin-III C-methyltransferase
MNQKEVKPKLIILGAGPGDPDLITVKGVKALKQANVILYDALASTELLAYASPTSRLINVGKRKGKHSFPQEEINQLIVFYAYRYGCVVRLKGGDPYVFGRGHEELEYAQRRGLDVEVIPGISSALAGPASVGIPLTKRGVNESFWVITGTLSSGEISNDIHLAAQSTATIVILMGMSNLNAICEIFTHARGEFESAAIIQNATRHDQKFVLGQVTSLCRLAEENEIGAPAIIVIGKVVDEAAINSISEMQKLSNVNV